MLLAGIILWWNYFTAAVKGEGILEKQVIEHQIMVDVVTC